MNFLNQKIQLLKNKKKQIKSQRKEINTTFNDPTQTDREVIKIDNEIAKEKINQLDQEKKDRLAKQQARKEQLITETKDTMRSIYKLLARLGLCNKTSFGYIMGKSDSYFRLYTGDYIHNIKYATLEEVKQNLYSLKTGLNILLESDDTLPPRDWIDNKISELMNKLEYLQYAIMEFEFKGV